ncbi:MAG: glutamate formimidoyltransferase [Planctomycetota bacterium]|nr:MAG: glutamate formimidoyltransferase [Planctomycetota bacterium]
MLNEKALIESIPNFSEGRRREVIDDIIAAVKAVEGVKVLDHSSDADHNRTVLTLAGSPAGLREAIRALYRKAAEHIDLRKHSGEHPRMGAVDVVPFVPLRNCTMEDCVEFSKEIGRMIWEEFGVPVFLYENSATSDARKNLAKIRKGEFEGMAEKMKQPEWKPDFGGDEPHPSLGVSAVGARMALIAFNVNLDTPDVEIANKIARAVRHISGGLRYCKAMGVELKDRNQTQVSMNLVNYKKTPIYRVVELIRIEAKRYGVNVVGSEIVGLVPMEAIAESFAYYVGLENYDFEMILESRL